MPSELKPVLVMAVAIVVGIVAYLTAIVMGLTYEPPQSPHEVDDICFVEGHPGATKRYVTYTPVLCSQPSKVIGPRLGADLGELSFEDVNGDNVDDAIVESSATRCRFGFEDCRDAQRVVGRVCPDCREIVKIIEKTPLPNLNTTR